MRKSLLCTAVLSVLLLSAVLLSGVPATAWGASTCPPDQTSGRPPLYCVPPTGGASSGPAPIARAASAALSRLSRSELLAKGGIALSSSLSGPGRVTVTITARLAGHTVVIGRGAGTAGAAGVVKLKIALTKAGRSALRGHKGKLQLKISASVAHGGKTTRATGRATLK
jgi:hypothetical protein